MRIRTLGTVACLLLLAICIPPLASAGSTRAGSGDPFTLWFDEVGNGFYSQNGAPGVIDPGQAIVDPISGLVSLGYVLPETVAAGDVRVWEDSSATVLSDLMRFENNVALPNGNTASVMFYFSEAGDSNLADANGIPPLVNINDGGGIFEVGPEDNNRFDWFPGGNIYHGVSDAPEPSSLLLLGSGVLGALGLARRRFLS